MTRVEAKYQKNQAVSQENKSAENPQYHEWIKQEEDKKHTIQITTVTYKNLKVWKVKLNHEKQFILNKCGNN